MFETGRIDAERRNAACEAVDSIGFAHADEIWLLRILAAAEAYELINVLGLAAGLACSDFILHWVMNELSYDRS